MDNTRTTLRQQKREADEPALKPAKRNRVSRNRNFLHRRIIYNANQDQRDRKNRLKRKKAFIWRTGL